MLIPSLSQVLPSSVYAEFGLSYGLERHRTTDYKGRFHVQSTYLEPMYFDRLVEAMRSLIHSTGLSEFEDFFFLIQGIGLKKPLGSHALPDHLPTLFPGIRWGNVDYEATHFDIGFEYYQPGSEPLTGIWFAAGSRSKFGGHTPLIQAFWGANNIFMSNFRLDPFPNFVNLSGLQYKASSSSKSIIDGLVKLVVYNKM